MLKVYRWGRIPLMCAIVLVNAYVFLTPWIPAIMFKLDPPSKDFTLPTGVPDAPQTAPATPPPTTPSKNTMYIPSIGLTEEIFEGSSKSTLNKGVWHRPFSSNPVLGGNTVVAGHRFSYKWRPVFYNLNNVKVGDEVYLDWNQQRYTYKVKAIRVVLPHDLSIEKPTAVPTFTIYTCTPLVTASHRLALIAERQ